MKTVVKRTVWDFLITHQAATTQMTLSFNELTCIEFLPSWWMVYGACCSAPSTHKLVSSQQQALMPRPFTGPKMFCADPNFFSQPKNLTAFSAYSKPLCRHKKQFYRMQIIFLSCTKYLWLWQYVNKFLARHKKFG